MAGIFAIRALREAKRGGFNPFGESNGFSSDDEEDDLDDVEEPPELSEAEELRLASTAKVGTPSKYDAAIELDDAVDATKLAIKVPPLAPFATAWETSCEKLYEDDDAEVFCVRWAPDDQLLAVGCGDGVVRIFHGTDGKLAYNLERDDGGSIRLPNTCLRWRPASANSKTKNVLLVANADGTIVHWHVTSRKVMHTITEDKNQVYALDYRHDGFYFATAGKDYKVRVYDEATKSLTHTLEQGWAGAPSAGHSNRIFALKFSPTDDNLLYSGGWDNTVQLWDLRTSTPTSSFYGAHLCGDSLDVHGEEVLTGSWRPQKQLQLWDTSGSAAAKDLKPTEMPFRHPALERDATSSTHVYAAQFSKPGAPGPVRIAAGGSGSNELRLFNRSDLGAVACMTLPRGVYGLDMSHDGERIAVAGGDCSLRVVLMPGSSGATLPAPPPPPLPAAPPPATGAVPPPPPPGGAASLG